MPILPSNSFFYLLVRIFVIIFVLSLFKSHHCTKFFYFLNLLNPVSSGSSRINTKLSTNACTLYCSFFICRHCIFWSCLIFPNNTSKVKINNKGDRGHPCLTPLVMFEAKHFQRKRKKPIKSSWFLGKTTLLFFKYVQHEKLIYISS